MTNEPKADGTVTPDLPPGAVISGQILVTSYIDPNGKMMFCVTDSGSLNLAQALGLLVLGGITVHEAYTEGSEDEQ